MTIYVRMTDKFMSGWGLAKNKTNVLVIECETNAQADQIEWAARQRPEMKNVMICANRPKSRPHVLHSFKKFEDMGGPWLKGWKQEIDNAR